MSKLGLECCSGHPNHSNHNENNNKKSCCNSEEQKVSKDTYRKYFYKLKKYFVLSITFLKRVSQIGSSGVGMSIIL